MSDDARELAEQYGRRVSAVKKSTSKVKNVMVPLSRRQKAGLAAVALTATGAGAYMYKKKDMEKSAGLSLGEIKADFIETYDTKKNREFMQSMIDRDKRNEKGPIKGTGARPDMKIASDLEKEARLRDMFTKGGREMNKQLKALSSEGAPKPKLKQEDGGFKPRLRDKLTSGGQEMNRQLSNLNSSKEQKKTKRLTAKQENAANSMLYGSRESAPAQKPPLPTSNKYSGAGGFGFKFKRKPLRAL